MFTARLRRRRHLLDTFIRVEVEERKWAAENAPVPLRPEASEGVRETANEDPTAASDHFGKLSA
jgi:hypothetical protein